MFKFWDEISSKLRRRQNVNVLFVVEKHMTDIKQKYKNQPIHQVYSKVYSKVYSR